MLNTENNRNIFIISNKNNIIGVFEKWDLCILEYLNKIIDIIDYESPQNFTNRIENLTIQETFLNSTIRPTTYSFDYKSCLIKDINGKSHSLNIDLYYNLIQKISNIFGIKTEIKHNLSNINTSVSTEIIRDNSVDLDKLQNKIEKLENIKKLQENLLDNQENKKKINDEIETYDNELKEHNKKINELKKRKEVLLEKKNIFIADLKIYNLIKDKVESNKMEIPLLFKSKYNIYKELEQNDRLTFENFLEINPKDLQVPISDKYSSIFEQLDSDKYAYISDDDNEYDSLSEDNTSIENDKINF